MIEFITIFIAIASVVLLILAYKTAASYIHDRQDEEYNARQFAIFARTNQLIADQISETDTPLEYGSVLLKSLAETYNERLRGKSAHEWKVPTNKPFQFNIVSDVENTNEAERLANRGRTHSQRKVPKREE